ncbi:hypothetical protein M885DRAFT_54291 [Pelagophyceae sp. CCMP2097]|nr:hypothetical protein M885DRAFT_54291 [Pelagophyceae sp. CCMP2097]
MRLLWAATLCVACGLQAAPRRLARLSKRASSDGRRAVQTAAPAPVQPGQTTDENAAWPSRVELNTLKAGDAVHGFVDSPVVTGKNGVKVWLDCGVVRTRVRQDGSRDVMHVSGMVRLPPRPWPKTAEFAALKATLSTLRSPLVAYVSASREESAQLVLSPFPPRLVEDVETVELMPLSALKVGDALEGSNVVAFVGQGRAFITVDVWHDAPLSKKRDKPILALLRGWALPHNASLATAFKGDGVKRVVRKGDRLGPVFVRKVTPLSARLEVSLEKVDPAKAQKQRQRRAAGFLKKRKTLENLKVGHVVSLRRRFGKPGIAEPRPESPAGTQRPESPFCTFGNTAGSQGAQRPCSLGSPKNATTSPLMVPRRVPPRAPNRKPRARGSLSCPIRS